ncbi:MAG: dienelactone hydrolase family protein [Bacteroidota bacterium]
MHKHEKILSYRGAELENAKKAMILVHGRGANPESILGLAPHLKVEDFALLAPAAKDHTWYPFSFLAPKSQNEPGLSSGLAVLQETLADIEQAGIKKENIYFLGFSQGACLVSEFLVRNADRYGGAFIYSGGVIGDQIDEGNYQGDFGGTPILIGCSDIDAHVPLHRVQDTTRIFKGMGAEVNERIYPGAPHTIFEDEIEITNQILSEG